MHELTDPQLLRAYAENGSEAAFGELVRRHVDLVYSAARRLVCDPHLAEDVTQGVFLALARSASQLAGRPVLSGWLHSTARNIAAQTVRTIERRRAREQEAATMKELLSAEGDGCWDALAPHLDALLGELEESEREAVLLRYFEHKSAREMAQVLGIGEEAAQKRVRRAVERLRTLFAKRGVTVGAAGLGTVLGANAVQAAPVGLAGTISAAVALAGTAVPISSTVAATKTIALTFMQKSLLTATLAVVATVSLVVQQQSQARLQADVSALQQQSARMVALQGENERLAKLLAAATASDASPSHDLLRLRGAVGVLRQQTNDWKRLAEENRKLTPLLSAEWTNRLAEGYLPRETWAFVGFKTPEDAFQSSAWAAEHHDIKAMLESMTPGFREQFKDRDTADGGNQALFYSLNGIGNTSEVKEYRVLRKEVRSDDEVLLLIWYGDYYAHGKGLWTQMKRVEGEWKLAARSGTTTGP